MTPSYCLATYCLATAQTRGEGGSMRTCALVRPSSADAPMQLLLAFAPERISRVCVRAVQDNTNHCLCGSVR